MKRKIIKIDEDLCNGCGDCVVGCEEGALKIIDGKAKLVRDDFCDGFGNCIGTCPTGALTIEEREADDYNQEAVKMNQIRNKVQKMQGRGVCPGSAIKELKPKSRPTPPGVTKATIMPSDLSQWPIQIHLVSPFAPSFEGRELVILATCAPVASADVHWRYLRGRSVVIGCPKLDNSQPYAEKLKSIITSNNIPKVTVVRMEVPCCMGIVQMAKEAVAQSGKDIPLVEDVISIEGEVISSGVCN